MQGCTWRKKIAQMCRAHAHHMNESLLPKSIKLSQTPGPSISSSPKPHPQKRNQELTAIPYKLFQKYVTTQFPNINSCKIINDLNTLLNIPSPHNQDFIMIHKFIECREDSFKFCKHQRARVKTEKQQEIVEETFTYSGL